MQRFYGLKGSDVVSQVAAGEAILIHFETGRYYATEGAGGEVIARLTAGESLEAIVKDLAARHQLPETEVATSVESFVAQLEREGLFEHSDEPRFKGPKSSEVRPAPSEAVDERDAVTPDETRLDAFHAPVLKVHTDLEDLLQLDPIHDVDDAGWPLAQSERD